MIQVSPDGQTDRQNLEATRQRAAAHLIGRERELELVLSAIAAGRDILVEGPPGTSKTTMLKAITGEWDIPLMFVEGSADLTPAMLLGHHNPARILREDYSAENFVAGPLVEAMREGGFLYIEELNRIPEDTLNTLLTAMADRETVVPRVGRISARETFRVIASMNPYDNIGTTRLSTSIRDQLCRVSMNYQDAVAEQGIVSLRTDPGQDPLRQRLVTDAVAVTRATRAHPAVHQGSSVRGAIDCVLVAVQLAALRAVTSTEDEGYRRLVFDAMIVALSGRIQLDETSEVSSEQVLQEIWEEYFVLHSAATTSD